MNAQISLLQFVTYEFILQHLGCNNKKSPYKFFMKNFLYRDCLVIAIAVVLGNQIFFLSNIVGRPRLKHLFSFFSFLSLHSIHKVLFVSNSLSWKESPRIDFFHIFHYTISICDKFSISLQLFIQQIVFAAFVLLTTPTC